MLKYKIKQILKKIPLIKQLSQLIFHPHIESKKISRNIKYYFENKNTADDFKKIPQIQNLIISLTSFPARMKYIEYTIFSLIRQSIRPFKIILWLSEEEFNGKETEALAIAEKYGCFGFEIKFVKENYKSYNKLIFSLLEYPDYIIVTADDDEYYKPNWLNTIYKTHKLFPNDIISNKIRRITFKNKILTSYLSWKEYPNNPSFYNLLLGYSGVLYPPKSLYKDVTKTELFLKLSPHADDIWFYVMAILENKKIIKPKYLFKNNFPIDYQLSDEWNNIPSLMNINWDENKNDLQLKAVLQHYSIYDCFMEKYK